jgi:autotransporter-associated beta strand protein
MKRILSLCCLLLVTAMGFAQGATDYKVWTGSGNWSNNANWTNGYGYGQLEFKGSGSATSNNDNSPANQWRLYFSGSQAYTLTGNQINLFDFAGNYSWILNDATVAQIIQNNVSFSDTNGHHGLITCRAAGPLTLNGTLAIGGTVPALKISGTNTLGSITINGVISGSGKPVDIGRNDTDTNLTNTRVFFNGINTYSGPTSLYAGTLTIPANSALGTGNLNIGNAAISGTLAVTNDTSRSQSLTVADGSTAAAIDVAATKTFELTGSFAQTGTNQATKIGKAGAGTLTLSSAATYAGQIQIGQGTVIANNNSALGTNTSTSNRGVDLGLNVGDVSQANNVSLLANNGITVGQSVYVAPNTSSATRTIGLNGSGSATFSNAIYLDGSLTLNGASGTVTVSGAMENAGGINVTGGTVVLSGNNTYTGSTTVTSGILRLGADNRISSSSPIVLSGGTFSSGATTGFTDNLGTLNLTGSSASTLALGTGNHSITFANSSAVSWGSTATLTITGWGGTAGASNTSGGKVYVGVGGLSSLQLSKVSFSGYSGTPIILGTGELVPPGPTLAVTAGALNHGSMCVGATASTITYTITNIGATAAGVTVGSNNPEFAVSNAPTTVNAGSTATYDVTFTPSGLGTRNATITINTTTPNSNAPVTSSLTGTGLALPTGTISGTTTVCRNSAAPSITFTGASATSPYTFTYSINGGANQTVTTVVGNSVTVSVPTATAGVYIYSLVNVISSAGCVNNQSGTATVTVDAGTTYYADTDNDGFGDAANPVVSCSGQPALTATNNTDCAPADPAKWQNGSFYVDADNDGYYNGNPEATTVCYGATMPSGYTASILGTDCDDANADANPNHVEIAANTIDDNCDGSVDEAGPVIGMIPSQCGTTMSNIAATIYSQQAASAQGYRFEVTNGANVRTYDSPTNAFSLLNLAGGAAYATTYSIRVAVKTAGFYRTYSGSCNITTPAAPATTVVIAAQCGTTLANIANLIYCNQVTAANQYRFEVSDGVGAPRTLDTSVNRFSLTSLVGGATYGVTYSIRVALRFGATWEPYGDACNVTTPANPGITNLIASQCGTTINNRWVTLYANQVPDAQGYRFEVTNGATVRYYNTAFSRFALGNLAGGVAAGTTYTVRVAVLYNSVYGAFGPACNVTTDAVFSRQAAAPVTVFEVKTYPNPFASVFKLDINTSGEAQVLVKVYDMIGKLVESKAINAAELGMQELGSQYPSGVYNVVVSQAENVKTLRIIKR